MKTKHSISDQLHNWSGKDLVHYVRSRFIQAFSQGAANSPPEVYRAVATLGVALAGFGNRTLQALWKCGMPLSTRAGAWAEVLSLGELCSKSTQNDLRARGFPRIGAGVLGALLASRRFAQGNLCHQLGVVEASRTPRITSLNSDKTYSHESILSNCTGCDHAGRRCAGGGRYPRRNACRFFMGAQFDTKFNYPGK